MGLTEEIKPPKVKGPGSKFNISDLKIDESKRGRPKLTWLRWVSALLGAILLVTGATVLVRQRVQTVEITSVRPETNEPLTLLNATGYVTPRRRATVAAKITGLLAQVLVDEGMRVEAGQELASLDNTDAQVRLSSAEADRQATQAALADLEVNLANAEKDLQRAEELRKAGITSVQAFDTARTAVDSLRARIVSAKEQIKAAEARSQIARQDLENTVIRAPFAGVVVSKDAQRGEMVSPISAGGGFTRTGIATIVDMTSLEIEVDVNESYIARVKRGQPVMAILDAYPDWKIPGKVRTLIPTADRQKATVKVRVSFDRLDPKILPDMGVKVSFLGDQPAKQANANAVLVPREAVRNENGTAIVFVYTEGQARRRPVRLGELRGSDQEILGGLSAGDEVLVNYPPDLRDAQRVKRK